MRNIAFALVAALVVAGCSGSPTTPSADGRALPPRSNAVTMPRDTTVLTSDTGMQTAPALDTGADSTALEGGFTMGSGN
jgi:ABC-type glycerol-3-phosphate transport system substrate-binding protein